MLSPVRRKERESPEAACPSTPLDHRRRISFSYTAPTNKVRHCDDNGSTFVMSSSGGRNKKASNRSLFPESSLLDDEESVLVASPFAYVTPPMPPRDQVSNTKTTKAMAKIVEEEGTPDSVIRKLAFGGGALAIDSPIEERRAPDTVNRASRVKSLDDDQEEDGFRFPMFSPESRDAALEEADGESSSSEGVSRLSLSMVDLNPPSSPQPLRQNATTRGDISESCTVPDLLANCGICGKQFISDRNLRDHSEFCKLEGRSRLGNSEASTLAQTTDTALVSVASSVHIQSADSLPVAHVSESQLSVFTDSPALPMYMQRALSATTLPSVAPPPMVASPSILSSPTEEEFLEEEISTFLDCLRGTDASDKWNSRRAKIGRVKSEHSLCVSSEDDELDSSTALLSIGGSKTGLVLAPVAPPLVPMSSNIYSPIPHQRSSFDQETSMTTSFLAAPGPMGSPCSPIVAAKLPSVTESLEELGRTSPNFGRLSLRSSIAPSVMDSAVTFGGVLPLRSSQRVACKCCGRKFATPSRLDRHEAVCEQVFSRSKPLPIPEPIPPPKEESCLNTSSVACKYCGRNFSHVEKLNRHEHVCLSVFKGRRRSKSPAEPGTAVRRARVTSFESVSIESTKGVRNWRVQQFGCLVVGGGSQTGKVAVGVQTVGLHHEPVRRELVMPAHQRSVSSSHSSESSLMSRSSLEFQYQQLRDQIKTCSEKLKLRRSIIYRDA